MKELLTLVFLATIASAQFTNTFTNFETMDFIDSIEEGDGLKECSFRDGYYMIEYYSGPVGCRTLYLRSNSEFSRSFGCVESFGAKMEWRYYEGKPFAVILRAKLPANDFDMPVSETLEIRGLDGFSLIDTTVNVLETAQANLRAQELADSLYNVYYSQ